MGFRRPLLAGAAASAAALLPAALAWAQDAAAPAGAAAEAAAPAAAEAAAKLPELSGGDTAWLLVSAALVLLMTPGLALFYGGMVRAKNVLNMLMQSFIAMSVITVIWVVIGYSLAFAPGNAFLGGMDYAMLKGVGQETFTLNGTGITVPHQLFMVFQMMFAIITPALISGAIAERMKFSAYVIFIALWAILAYSPMAHMVWGEGGYLFKAGALDFAGGTVVHILSGISALTLAILLGKRKISSMDDTRPHNLPMTLIGTGLLWFGWFGFNAGSAVGSNGLAAQAFVVTHIAAATAGLAWVLIEWATIKKPTALGFATGAVAGLVAITPAAGFVSASSALIIGAVVSFVSYGAIKIKSRAGYDDTLDVFGVHCVGGIWGAIATGLFAEQSINAANTTGNGLLMGGGMTLLSKQLLGIGIALVLGVVVTLLIGTLLKVTIGLRATTVEEDAGLDLTQHGEEGYVQPGGTAESITRGPGSHGAHSPSVPSTATAVTAEA